MPNMLKKLVEKLTSTTVLECEKGELKPLSDEQKAELVRATVPRGVTTIPHEYFRGCATLTEIFLPDSLEIIGKRAFCECTALKVIGFPENLREIQWGAFQECTSLETIDLPEGIAALPPFLFYRCTSLTRVHLPSTVRRVDPAFRDCAALKHITCRMGSTIFTHRPFSAAST